MKEIMEEFQKHVEDSSLVLARVSVGDQTEAHDQLERLTRSACRIIGIDFDFMMKRAQSVLTLEKAGLATIQKIPEQ